jgi:restriction system protein
MTIPDYESCMLPVLRFVAGTSERTNRECEDHVAAVFALSAAEREQLLQSGRQRRIANKVHWAITYMTQAGLLARPRRGVVTISPRGQEVLSQEPSDIDNRLLSRFPEFLSFKRRTRSRNEQGGAPQHELSAVIADGAGTPEDRIEGAYAELTSALQSDLLSRITAADPTFFEHVIIDLMVAMGYGGSGSAHHLGRSADGGVDGVINEDPLGLDVVYLQAKRYQTDNVVGVDKIREFAGSLDEKRSTKGVFVTTSRFAPAARAYAQSSPKRLILIDGDELGRLLVDYGVGVRVFRTVALKRVDLDYFAPEDEGES